MLARVTQRPMLSWLALVTVLAAIVLISSLLLVTLLKNASRQPLRYGQDPAIKRRAQVIAKDLRNYIWTSRLKTCLQQ